MSEVLGSNAAQAMGFQLFAPIDNAVILSNGGTAAQGTGRLYIVYIYCVCFVIVIFVVCIVLR